MADNRNNAPAPRTASGAIDAFLDKARDVMAPADRGRLIFALDATMSRQPTWDIAQAIQRDMFRATAALGGLAVQLVYFRGFSECRASQFVSGGDGLAALMSRISCRGGHTQIEKVLRHVLQENAAARVGALVYIGDAMEERADDLAALAGEMGLRGVKAFMFHEGSDGLARQTYQEIARLSGGAYAAFDGGAPGRLRELLAAAAAYAAGGRKALEGRAADGEDAARLLLSQMR